MLNIMTRVSSDVILQETSRQLISSVSDFEKTIFENYNKKLKIPEHTLYEDGVQIAVYDAYGGLVLGRNPFGIDMVALKETTSPQRLKYSDEEFYLIDRKITIGKDTEYWIRGAASISEKMFTINFITSYNALFIMIFTVLTGIGGYIIVRNALIPVDKIRATAQDIIENSDFSERIMIGDGSDEIHTLANTFNDMLATVEQSFEKEKQFTSDASHELRTPIAVILSQCEYVEECVEDIGEAKEAVSSIKHQTEKMSKLVSELLWIARADNNKIKLHIEEENVSEILSFVCEEQIELHGENIKLTTNIAQNVMANIDSSLMVRLFINTITNAYQYNKENGEIFVTLSETDDHLTFLVKDTGIGIPKESLSKIWDRFYQVDSSRISDGNGNSGLGLSMVKWIADAHHATIDIQSEIDKGTTFVLTINKTINPLSS